MGGLGGSSYLGKDFIVQWSALARDILLGNEVVNNYTRHVVGIREVGGLVITPETE
jgi:hypothetical protein